MPDLILLVILIAGVFSPFIHALIVNQLKKHTGEHKSKRRHEEID